MAFDQLYDVIVQEFAVQFWQYQTVGFEDLRAILEMPEGTPEALQAKPEAEFAMLMQIQTPMDWSVSFFSWPYYINAATTYGQYHYDFSWLRAALGTAGDENTLSVTEEMQADAIAVLQGRLLGTDE